MKKKTLLPMIIASFLLSACTNNASPEQSSGVSDTGADTVSPSEASTSESANVSSSDTGYKQAYKELIEAEAKKIAATSPESDEYEECIDSYTIYDIDKDNIPELFIRFGHCEASYCGKLYTYADGKAQLVEETGMSHTSLHSVPDENGVLFYMGHMGIIDCYKLMLKDGKAEYEELFEDDINEQSESGEDAESKDINDVVPGSYYLEEYDYNNTYPIEKYEVIADFSKGTAKAASDAYTYPDNNPEFYNELMQEGGTVNAVSLDTFMKTPGEIPFSQLLEKSQIYEYYEGGGEINGVTYADLNSDGIYECIFYIGEHNEYSDNDKEYRVILSAQDGKVYAYLAFSPYEDSVTEDGYFIEEPDEYVSERSAKRVFFDKENCFTFGVPCEQN